MGILHAIVRLALRHRGVVIALGCLLLGYGVYALSEARYDVFPEFAPPQVAVETEAPGFAPEQVEQLVTQPIENALQGIPGVTALRSQSIPGISSVTMNFDPRADLYRDRQMVAERLGNLAAELPTGVKAPQLTPLFSSTGDALIIGLTSDTRSLLDVRTLAEWTVRPHLLAVPGVASVSIYGGGERQVQIQLQPDRLVRYGLSVGEVLAAARGATGLEGAGYIDTPAQRLVLRTDGQMASPEEIARTVIRWRDGEAVTLGDVAKVVAAPAPAIGEATVLGRPGVLLKVSMQYGANTLAVTRGLDAALRDLAPVLRGRHVTLYPRLFRAADFIQTAVGNVRDSLLLGAVLVVAVLFLFLFNLRTAAISCTAIPLSLLAAVIVLEKLGLSLNTMTMGGLAIAIGEVVDDAVIDVENILRRLRENRHAAHPRPAFAVVLAASLEVRSAVVYATFAVVLVFLPIMTMSDLAGRMFAPLGEAYILAVLASLAVALTLTPALCLALLGRGNFGPEEPPLVRRLHGLYARVLRKVEMHFRWVLGAVAALTLAAVAAIPFLDGSFLPALQESHLILHMTMAPGTSFAASAQQGEAVTRALLKLPAVRMVGQKIGHAEFGEVRGPEGSEIDIDLKPGSDTDAVSQQVLQTVAEFSGASYSVNSFFVERINETLSGYTSPVVVNLFGNDLSQLDAAAQTVSRRLAAVPGASGVQVQAPPAAPVLAVRLRPEALRRWGLDPVAVLDAVRVAYGGAQAGQIYEGNAAFAVSVILDPKLRNQPAEVARLPLRTPAGRTLLLGQVADISMTTGRSAVLHDGARRVQAVTCDVRGRSVADFTAAARAAIDAPGVLPAGVVAAFAGSAGAQAQARRDLLMHGLLAGAGIVLLLAVVLRQRNNLLLVLLNLPFALVGGVLAVVIGGGDVSLGALVGFVTVFGITLRNAIMLISHYEHLVAEEGQAWGPATALRGAAERLAPILMTALVTGLGLLPLALGSGAPGREIEGPMALVILGGLATSTALNLLVLPTLALRFGRFGLPREEEGAEAGAAEAVR